MALNDALTRLKRGFKALFKGSRSKRNSNAATATKSKRQSQHTRFRNSDLAPLVSQDDTLVQDDTLIQTSYISDPGLHVTSSPSTVSAPQRSLQQRHSTALISHAHPDPGRASPVSKISRRTLPATSAPSPIDTAAANTMTAHRADAGDSVEERHEVAATPVIAPKMSLPEQVQTSAEEEEPAPTHEVWRGGEDETLFVPGATLDESGQHSLHSVPEKVVLPQIQPPVKVPASPAVDSAADETKANTPETSVESTMEPDKEKKEIDGQAVPLAREASSGAFPTMLATSGPLQDFYYVDTEQNKERYPGRMAC